ncbi:MAG: hypothetical protein Q4D04_12310, partial [Clostridia bacterium]|nr:hypothetical protein [Clostridia bacterium]
MFRNFAEIERFITSAGHKKTIALAGSHDADALLSVVEARRKGVINACLIGDEQKTRELLKQFDEDAGNYRFVDEPVGGRAAANIACQMVKDKQADMPMKGGMQTSEFMRAILDKSYGFIADKGLLCQATVL